MSSPGRLLAAKQTGGNDKYDYPTESPNEHPANSKNVNQAKCPFGFPPSSHMLAYSQYCKTRKRQKRYQIGTGITTQKPKEQEQVGEALAMTDVNPEYFKELSGQIVAEKLSLHLYLSQVQQIFRTRLLVSQQSDNCMRVKREFEEEQARLLKIKDQCQKYMSGFEVFLSKDHQHSSKILEKAEFERKLTDKIAKLRDGLSQEYSQLSLELYSWEESWRTVKMCKEFLYDLWPRKQEQELKSRQSSAGHNPHDPASFSSRYHLDDAQVNSLDALMDSFEQDCKDANNVISAAEAFSLEDPTELIRTFRSIEAQNLNALIHLESLAAPITEMSLAVSAAEEQIKAEIGAIAVAVEDIQVSIQDNEARAARLEQEANDLVRGVFRDSICSPEVLCLRVFVEDAYESCIGPNNAHLESFLMMARVEGAHEELHLRLDSVPRHVVQSCEREGFKEELRAIRETEEAVKKYDLMRRLLDALKRLMESPVRKKRQLMWRSTPIFEKTTVTSLSTQPTDQQLQYLNYFTDYCKDEKRNNLLYLSLLADDFDFELDLNLDSGPAPNPDATSPDPPLGTDSISKFKTALP